MIIKSLSRKSNSAQLIKYVLRYILRPEKHLSVTKSGQEIDPSKLLIRHNVRARTLKGIITTYNRNESFRLVKRKDSVRLYHSILSLSSRDNQHVDEAMLKDLTQKFIDLRGKDNLYVACPHFDRDHSHVHILISGTATNGRSSRISKQKFKSLKLALDAYQKEKYPFLVHSLPRHGLKNRARTEQAIETIKASRQTIKEQILVDVERIYTRASSMEDFGQRLKKKGYELYYRNGKVQGLKAGRFKYRFSRLGIDEKRLQDLDRASTALRELQELRNGSIRERPRKDNRSVKALEELANIRQRGRGRGLARSAEDD